MSSLKLAGLGAAGGTVGVLVLGMIFFNQFGDKIYANILGLGLIIFIIGGAAALLARAGLIR